LFPGLQVLADDAHLISASEDRSWCLWDMNQEKMLHVFKANMGAVRGVALAPDQVMPSRHSAAGGVLLLLLTCRKLLA